MADRLGNGLQNRVEQFDSARYLNEKRNVQSSISLFSFIHISTNSFVYENHNQRLHKSQSKTMKKPLHIIIYIPIIYITSLLLHSCANTATSNNDNTDGDTIVFKYAEHITAVRHNDYIEVTLSNPWKPQTTLHRYALVSRSDSGKVVPPSDRTTIYTPIRRAVVSTSPHCRLLFDLGAGNTVKGVCDLAYITQQEVRQLAAKGVITDCGNSMSPTMERIISISPDAIFMSPFEGCSYTQLENLGTPIVECADYMETSALGRAEWMRFYAMLTDKEATVDSLFSVIESRYKAVAKHSKAQKNHPKVITERVTNGVWYCPGGNSSMAKVIEDAGGNYVFANDKHSGSLNLSPEIVINKATNADVWLFVYYGDQPLKRSELLTEYGGYKLMKAFQRGNIYECNGKNSSYFEEISFRPDLLLDELSNIFHSKSPNQRYYKRISE